MGGRERERRASKNGGEGGVWGAVWKVRRQGDSLSLSLRVSLSLLTFSKVFLPAKIFVVDGAREEKLHQTPMMGSS